MKKAWFLLPACALSALIACTDKQPQADAAARQAEAAEAQMDAEAVKMVAAADSMRAADTHVADSLSSQPSHTPKASAPKRRKPATSK